MSVKLHGFVGSTATFRVMAALAEKDLDFDFVPVDFVKKEQKTPEFLARNPFGEVPVYEDADLTLFESRAITKYIAEAYADKGTQLIAADPKKSAIQTVWSEVEGQKYDPAAFKLVYQLLIIPILYGGTTDEAIVAEFEQKLADILDVYESRLTTSKYLGGDSFTLVDLHHLPTMYYLFRTNIKRLFDERPHVSAWASDILSRPAWVKVTAMANK